MVGVPDAGGCRLLCPRVDDPPVLFLGSSDADVEDAASKLDEDPEEAEETLVLGASGEEAGSGRGGRPCCLRTRVYAAVA